jgi:hypothetical protein
VSDDDPRWRSPEAGHGADTPVSRMGPPPRSFAADAHDRIMVRSLLTYRIQGCGALIRARWQLPLGPLRCPTTDQLRSTGSKIDIDRTVGTTIEWYDFLLYSVVTGLVFGKLFFPKSEPLVGVLQAFAVYSMPARP